MELKPRFTISKKRIDELAEEYRRDQTDYEKKLENSLIDEIFPAYKKRKYLTKDEFLVVCSWRTSRAKPTITRNEPELIKAVSQISFETPDEWRRIKIWTHLDGVSMRTASVFLHFAFNFLYPIIDIRALWSLGVDEVTNYFSFDLWKYYTCMCRTIASKNQVSMRDLDRALWQYSKNEQG